MDTLEFQNIPMSLVPMDDLRKEPGPYCMSYAFDPEPLILSIDRVGLLHLPLIQRNETGKMDVVSGFRRIHALLSLDRHKVPCRILPESLSSRDCLLLAFHDNLAMRPFNDIEKCMALHRLRHHFGPEELVNQYLPLLDVPPRLSILDYYLNLEGFENPIRMAVAKNRLSPKIIKLFFSMDSDTRISLSESILNLNLNFNHQIQFIEYISDIAIKYNLDIPVLLRSEPLHSLILPGRDNAPQRSKKVLKYLRDRRFPRLVRIEKAFQQKISSLRLPKGVRIQHSPYFEGAENSVQISFRNGPELIKKLNELLLVSGLSSLDDIQSEDP